MQNVPKIVSERLRATPTAVDHPEADVLGAFAECSLLDRERAIVLEHLSRCRDCRDIVALALPATEAAQTVVTPARSGWLTWPALRWGFVAAGVVAIASVGIVQYQRPSRPTTTVAREMRNEPVATYSQAQPQAATEAKPAGSLDKTRQAEKPSSNAQSISAPAMAAPAQLSEERRKDRSVQPSTTHAPKFGAPIGGPIASSADGYKMQAQWQQQGATAKQQNADTVSNLKIPPASQTVEVSGSAPQLETTEAQPSQLNTEASNLNAPLASRSSENLFGEDNSQQLTRAKPPVNAMNGAAVPNVIPSWGISSAGALQRSFDHGSTWQDVNVTANLVPNGSASFARRAVNVRAEQKKVDNADKNLPPAVVSTPVFRTVAATGTDVWAGGSNGALYHSLDAGNHWKQVTPSAAGATLTGDVIRMEFADAQHGTITTSTLETWITSDDGLNWQKR